MKTTHSKITGFAVAAFAALLFSNASAQTTLVDEDFQTPTLSNGTTLSNQFAGWNMVSGPKARNQVNSSDVPSDTANGSNNQVIQFEWADDYAEYDISHNWNAADVYHLRVEASPMSWSGQSQRYVRPELRQQNNTLLWQTAEDATTAVPLYDNFGRKEYPSELIFFFEIPASSFTAGVAGQPIKLRIGQSGARGLYINNVKLVLGPLPADGTAPVPDPVTWDIAPTLSNFIDVNMKADSVRDPGDLYGVEYYFENMTNSTNSGWQDARTWSQTGLDFSTTYNYRVKARDKSPGQNETAWSSTLSVTTATQDLTPPSPDPLTWETVPEVADYRSITMGVDAASDPAGVEYYFENITNGNNSGWQDARQWTEKDLDPNTSYTYRARARDKSIDQNVSTTWSSEESATTPTEPLETLFITRFQDPLISDNTGNPDLGDWVFSGGNSGNIKMQWASGDGVRTDTDIATTNQVIQFEYTGRVVTYNIPYNWSPSDTFVLTLNASPQSWSGESQRYIRPSLSQQDGTVLWAPGENMSGPERTALPLWSQVQGNSWQDDPNLAYSYTIPASAFTAGTPGEPIAISINSSGARGLFFDNVRFGLKTTTVTEITRAGGAPATTNATTVSWDVTFEDPVTGLTASNFELTGSLAGSSSFDVVEAGAGNLWTVSATTSGCGTLGLRLANGTGASPKITNAPFPTVEGPDQVYDIDTVAPVISCAKQIVVTVEEGSSATVSYAPTAWDECEGASVPVVCDPPSPGTFAIGNHVVECTATDSAGNVGTASFNVVVLVQQPVNGERFLEGISVRGDEVAAGTGIAPDTTILSIGSAFLNDGGDVVFDATLQGNGANSSAVFFRPDGGSPSPVAVKGNSFGAGSYGIFSNLSLNDAGGIGFQSLTSGNLPGHFAGPGAGPVANSALRLGAAPTGVAGEVYNGLYQPALASNGELLTPAALLLGGGGVSSTSDTLITSSAGTVLAREGSATGTGDLTHGQFLARVVASDEDGHYAFPSLVFGSTPAGGNAGIFVGQLGGGSPSIAVRKGDAAADTPGTFGSFLGESVNSSGEIALRAFAFGGGVTASDNEGIWTNSGNASAPPVLVAREGDVTPCIGEGLIAFSSFKTVYMGDDGSVCFLAYLRDATTTPAVFPSNDASIWLWRNGVLDLIVREGDVANSTDSCTIARLVDFDSNGDADGGNGIVYSVDFVPGIGDASSRTNQAVYVDRGGEDLAPVLVLRRGDSFDDGEDESDILSLRISTATSPSGSTGGLGRAINGDGDVLLNVGFTGSRSGIFVLSSPPVPD